MALPPSRQPSTIHLDYGVDSAPFDPRDLKVCQRGLHLRTRWRFEPGTEIALNFQIDEGGHGSHGGGTAAGSLPGGPRTLRTVGVVVGCDPDERASGFYRLTLMFVEMTGDVRTLVRAMTEYHRRDGHAQGKRPLVAAGAVGPGGQPRKGEGQRAPG